MEQVILGIIVGAGVLLLAFLLGGIGHSLIDRFEGAHSPKKGLK